MKHTKRYTVKTMQSIKNYVANAIQSHPKRYGSDAGDLHLINDYFIMNGWPPLEVEQHNAIASLIRQRNYFLQEHNAYDLRIKKAAFEHVGQTSIYDFMDSGTAEQSKKLIRYWSTDPERFKQSNSRIKKSVRGIDDEHIQAVKLFYILLKSNPKLKQKRRQRKAPKRGGKSNVFGNKKETKLSKGTE